MQKLQVVQLFRISFDRGGHAYSKNFYAASHSLRLIRQ